MTNRKEIFQESDYLSTLKTILETYEEIAASRMQRIRTAVLTSRNFVFEINAIFQEVKSSYKKALEVLMKARKIKDFSKLSFIKRNGKTLFVFLSANTRLYGDIIKKTFDLFAQSLKKEKNDVAIIGKLGLQYFQQEFGKTPFTYFDLPDNKIDNEAFKQIIPHLILYEKIIVFYQQFKTIVTQEPEGISISGDLMPSEVSAPQIKYLFEPSLEKILEFFEKEIFASIFEQTIFESQLAKFAARMVSLDTSVTNTRNRLKQVIIQQNRIKHQIINKKQLETFTSIMMLQV